MNDKDKEPMNLFECASLFGETMNERFPDGDDGCAIFMVATDGKKMSSLTSGKDRLVHQMVANVAAKDEELRDLIADAVMKAYDYALEQEEDEDLSSVSTD